MLVCIMLYQKEGPLRSPNYFFAKCALILYFAGNIKRQGGKGGGNEG